MDIGQILSDFQAMDTAGYTEEQLDAFAQTIRDKEVDIATLVRQIQDLRQKVMSQKYQIQAAKREAQNQTMAQTMAEKGYKPGAIFYIDRHEGLYVVASVDQDHVNFKRRREGSTYGKTVREGVSRIDPRLTPLRTQGPFRVGDIVTRNGQEFKVEGYLGYRMVLSFEKWGDTIYNIISKKDEITFKAFIL